MSALRAVSRPRHAVTNSLARVVTTRPLDITTGSDKSTRTITGHPGLTDRQCGAHDLRAGAQLLPGRRRVRRGRRERYID